MVKPRAIFACQQCGETHPRWAGRCDACGAWNSIREESGIAVALPGEPRRAAVALRDLRPEDAQRATSGIAEFDRVIGGGLVPGSTLLIGGDPGVGKSTLLLEIAAQRARRATAAKSGARPLYVTAEESAGQIALRAQRLGLADLDILVLSEDRLEPVLDAMLDGQHDLVVIDSIQTVRKESLSSAAGTVAQVRECASDLVAAARRARVPLVLVGHVTKDGLLAGPRVLEHLVDTVLYFEGERDTEFRILRAVKNRFGPAGEVAVFAMGEKGLVEPEHAAAAFLGAARGLPGAVVAAVVEGSRVFMVEVQALTSRAIYGPPRVRSNGVESARASMLAAVLSRRCGLELGDQDIHLNIAGGFRVSDPGCDLAVCLAIASSFLDRAVQSGLAVFGEVGLGGEVRAARSVSTRLREAEALRFERVALPAANEVEASSLALSQLERVRDILDLLL